MDQNIHPHQSSNTFEESSSSHNDDFSSVSSFHPEIQPAPTPPNPAHFKPFNVPSHTINNETHNDDHVYSPKTKEDDEDSVIDADIESRKPKKPVAFSRVATLSFLGLCMQCLGGIYGDLGTSVLYTYSTVFTSTPTKEDILGSTSCIFYAFTLIVIFKYCWIVFSVGENQKQGGAVAVFAKLATKLDIAPRGVEIPNYNSTLNKQDALLLRQSTTRASFLNRQNTMSDTTSLNTNFAAFKHPNSYIKRYFSWVPLFLTFVCTGLIIADGLLTPTTSVLSAIGAIAVPAPSVADKVVIISCIILGALFVLQQVGSAKISYVFGPIILIWIIAILMIGIYNVRAHPGVFVAFSPKIAIDYLRRKGIDGMSAIILAITGTEAMFADLGHYSVWSVRTTMFFFCYPALMMSYFGQAARLIENPELYTNVFFRTIPGTGPDGLGGGAIYWVVFVLATLATVIASQATILGVSSMYMQLENIDCLPKLSIIHTSKTHIGKIYIPFVNYLMGAAVILTTIGFKNSNNVTNAYGLCIALTFFFTTCLITITMRTVYNLPWFVVIFFFISFGTLDACFSVAGLRKIKSGAWFPLMISILIIIFMCMWRWARSYKINLEFKSRLQLKEILSKKSLSEQTSAVKQAPVLDLNNSNALTPSVQFDEKNGIASGRQKHSTAAVSRAGTGRHLYLAGTDRSVAKLPGMAIFHSNVYYTINSPNTVPRVFSNFLNDFPALHESLVFLGVRMTSIPFVDDEDRITVTPMSAVPGFYRAIVRFGFLEPISFDEKLMKSLQHWVKQVRSLTISRTTSSLGNSRSRLYSHTDSRTISSELRSRLPQEEPQIEEEFDEDYEANMPEICEEDRPPVHIFAFESLHGDMFGRASKYFKPVAWVRDCLLNYVFEPIESACVPQESRGHVVQTEEYPQSVFTLSKTIEV